MIDPGAGLSEAQAATALRVHPKTMARWRKAGLIAHDRSPGGCISYLWNDVLDFRMTMRRTADAPICSHMSGEPKPAAG